MSLRLSTSGIKRLEITMRDVLDGLEDTAIFMHYKSSPDVVEVLSIEANTRPTPEYSKIIPINQKLNDTESDIVEYLIQREAKKSA